FRDRGGDTVNYALFVESACWQADRVIEKDGRSNRGEICHLGRGKPDRNDREGIFHIFHRSGLEDEWSNITVFTTAPSEGWRRASTATVEDVRRLAGRPRAFGDAIAVFAHRRARRRWPRRWLRPCRILGQPSPLWSGAGHVV